MGKQMVHLGVPTRRNQLHKTVDQSRLPVAQRAALVVDLGVYIHQHVASRPAEACESSESAEGSGVDWGTEPSSDDGLANPPELAAAPDLKRSRLAGKQPPKLVAKPSPRCQKIIGRKGNWTKSSCSISGPKPTASAPLRIKDAPANHHEVLFLVNVEDDGRHRPN